MGEAAEDARGADHYGIAWRLTAAGWVGCALLQLILYLRPSPYGGPFLAAWKAFIIRPLVYELLAVWLIALPFLLLWLVLWRRKLPSPWRLGHWGLMALMALNLLLTAFDHELYRFLGLRLGPNFLDVYADPTTLADSLFLNVLRGDRGGPFLSPVLCVAAPALYLWWSVRLVRRRTRAPPLLRLGLQPAIALLVLPLATGLIGYSLAHARFRLARLEPALFAAVRDFYWSYEDDAPPGDPDALARAWQAEWLAGSADRGWRFPDRRHPFVRVPAGPSAPAPRDRWNVVIIQLESVRGVDTGHLRPDRSPSPTPYVDSLAARPDAAVWTRALSFGPPSINGRFATLCSITPTSRRFITAQTRASFYCLADALRRHGYRAEMFAAGDIDMDNSTIWVQRMYDRLWRYPQEGQRDREIFRHAAARIRLLGRQGPFLATLISASNHHPFRSPEPTLDIAGYATVHERILNTVRYTDDVVRELVESLRGEPWFERTLIVINSDHGYNLGEHGGLVGAYSLHRESVWTPFLIVGPHPRLPVGRHDNIVTLLDVAPTIADLIGVREANPWHGHSLLAVHPQRRIRFGFRDALLAEAGGWSAVRDPQDGRPHLYDARRDWLQRRNLAARHPELARRLLEEADRSRRFNDYLIRHGRVWPRTSNPP
ncbi:MAG TPA: sulfatase-like hydrolase/transferase [Allosphingosinicella sp.]|nr:sulfatase-like hydrolase/transferase [Allosphingosinicella sp.]